jgi:GNAT superfamily N-acetyltransferase
VYNVGIPILLEHATVASLPAATQTLIREATEADLPRLLELYVQLAELGTLADDTPTAVAERHRAALRALHDDPRATCLVLEVDGRVDGTLTLYLLPALGHDGRPFAIVEHVVVEAALRGGGYGRLLMEHAERLAGEHGCYKVALTSNNKREAAHQFYAHIGYVASHQGFTKYDGRRRLDDA